MAEKLPIYPLLILPGGLRVSSISPMIIISIKQGSINYSFSPGLATISTHKLLYPLPSLPPVFNYNDLHILPLHTITMVGKQKQTINFTEIFLNQLWILCMKLKKILQFQHLCIVTTMSHVRLVWISSIFWVNFN